MFAPSRAHFNAMAFPMPRLAPVMNTVRPASFLQTNRRPQAHSTVNSRQPDLPCVQHAVNSRPGFSFHPGRKRMTHLLEQLRESADAFAASDESSDVFLVACKECFDHGQHSEVAALLSDEKRRRLVERAGWDLIGVVSDRLNHDIDESEKDGVLCNILNLIGRVCSPREVCLCVSERLTSTLYGRCLRALIATLESALVRMKDDWPKMLKSARCVLVRQLESFYSPNSESYESEEDDETEENKKTKRKQKGEIEYDELLPVLESLGQLSHRLVTEAFHTDDKEKLEQKRRELGVFLVCLLGIPLVHCKVVASEANCSSKVIALKKFVVDVMGLLHCIRFHAIKVMEFAAQKRTVYRRRKDGDEGNYYVSESDDYELPPLACGCFSYLLLVQEMQLDSFPNVYSPIHLLRINLPLVEQLIIQSSKQAVEKGVTLLDTLSGRVNKGSVPKQLLNEKIVRRVAECLIDLMIHNSSRILRKLAVSVLPRYLSLFEAGARYRMLFTLLAATDHSGVAALLIHEAKNDVIQYIDAVIQGHQPDVGSSDVQQLFSSVFTLKAGQDTDLLQELDRTMASLNLLRFVLLRDKKEENVTGIWSQIARIEEAFLDPVREVLGVTKTYWQHETELLKQPVREQEREDQPEINVRLQGGGILPDISRQHEGELAHSAVVMLDMLESVLARVCDIIAMS